MQENFLSQIKYSSLYVIPEIILTIGILFLILLSVIKKNKNYLLYSLFAFVIVAISLFVVISNFSLEENYVYFDMIVIDKFSLFFKTLFTISTLFLILVSMEGTELSDYSPAEYFILILSMLIGMNLLASSNNLIMIYLSLEMLSVASYLLSGYLKRRKDSLEASLKYVIYGATSSGILLYGFTYLYGLTGSLSLNIIKETLKDSNFPPPFLLFIMILILAGIGYKISSVPFHFWTPDVYEGAPTAITAHLSVASKAAGFALFLRLFFTAFSYKMPAGNLLPLGAPWIYIIAAISVLTMTLGNVVAIVQKNIKRLLAYSTIAHAGYMIMGLICLNDEGIAAIMFYLLSYLVMNLGAFYIAIALYPSIGSYDIEDYKGLWRKNPTLALAMTFFLLSLTGIPPFIGFFAKFILFAAVINAGWVWLAVVAVLNSVVSLYYYAYVIKIMVLDLPSEKAISKIPKLVYSISIFLAAITFIFGPAFQFLYNFSDKSNSICDVKKECSTVNR